MYYLIIILNVEISVERQLSTLTPPPLGQKLILTYDSSALVEVWLHLLCLTDYCRVIMFC